MCLKNILAMNGHMNVKPKEYWHWSELSCGLPVRVNVTTCVAHAGTNECGSVTRIRS